MSSDIKLKVLLVGLLISTLIFAIVSQMPEESRIIELETNHLVQLDPHEHDAGEAVEDVGHQHVLYSPILSAPYDAWIHEMSFDIVNAPDTTVHHVTLFDLDRPHQTCKNIHGEQLIGFSQDNMFSSDLRFPKGMGMHIKKGDRLFLSVMEHNPLPPMGPGGIYRDVYGKISLRITEDTGTSNLKNVHFQLLHLDQEPCNSFFVDGTPAFIFGVPAHSKNYTYAGTHRLNDPSEFTFKSTSTIVHIGGHLHGWQGGKIVTVRRNDQPFLNFPTTRSQANPYLFNTVNYMTDLKMLPGDHLSLSTVYDNPGDVPIRGAMGDLGIYYYEQN